MEVRTTQSDGSPSCSEFRVCIGCGQKKHVYDFPIKSGKIETEIRRDKRCKSCKARTSMERRKSAKCEIPKRQRTAKGIIEPRHMPKRMIELKANETSDLVTRIDFTDLEKTCGKSLDHIEKYDAVQGFNEFISLLREGYGEMIGAHVYIRKN